MSWGCTCTVRLVKLRFESCSIWRYCAEYKYTIQYNTTNDLVNKGGRTNIPFVLHERLVHSHKRIGLISCIQPPQSIKITPYTKSTSLLARTEALLVEQWYKIISLTSKHILKMYGFSLLYHPCFNTRLRHSDNYSQCLSKSQT